MTLPLLDDLRDRRARVKPCAHALLDATAVAVPPALLAVLTLIELLTDRQPWLAPVAGALLPILCVGGIVYVISAREPRQERRPGFLPHSAEPAYRYCRGSRRAAKILLLPMLVTATCVGWANAPNLVRGRDASGYVCRADGRALQGYVQLASRGGVPLGTVALDDRGFFFLRLGAWSSAPESIALVRSPCSDVTQRWDTARRGIACPSESVESPQTGQQRVWIVSCP